MAMLKNWLDKLGNYVSKKKLSNFHEKFPLGFSVPGLGSG
jgi:hypothetical protein